MNNAPEHTSHLFAYCERAGDPGLWAEPLNAVTNLFFLFYALASCRMLLRLPDRSFRAIGDIWLLAFFMALIGFGSGLWHIWAAPGWTVLVDTIPIYLFINLYIFSLYRRVAQMRWGWIIIIWVLFTAASSVVQQLLPMDTLNGSLMYIPTLAFMWFSAALLWYRRNEGYLPLLACSGLFLISLIFRTADSAICAMLPFGTHFVWHILNAMLLYYLVKILVKAPSGRATPR